MRYPFLGARRAQVVAAPLLLLGLVGCGTRHYPVRGTVTFEDGKPLTRGMVIFESPADGGGEVFMARGEVKRDGSYQLSTGKPGDGVPAGKYRVLISSMDLSDLPDEKKKLPFNIKYTKFETSGLEYEVKAGPNEYPIKLDRPARPPR